MVTGTSSGERAAVSDDDFYLPEYVRVALLTSDNRRILMLESDANWDLPYFEYPKSLHGKLDVLFQDLQHALHISSTSACFNVVQELLGDYGSYGKNEGEVGFAQLFLVECHLDNFAPPSNAAWQDAEFLSNAFEEEALTEKEIRDTLDILLGILNSPSTINHLQVDPRYRFGWFDKASKWLVDAASRDGREIVDRVFQENVSCTSTILKVNTSRGWYFLKCPALGLNETSMTWKICSLFPESTPDIIDSNLDQNWFVSKGFNHIELDESHQRGIILEMARLQMSSIRHMEILRAAGCQVRGPEQLAKKIEGWLEDGLVKRVLGGTFKSFKMLAHKLTSMCYQLMKSKIPLTLVHGDLSLDNAALRLESNRKYLLFDWQYACISHPFVDLHGIHRTTDRTALQEYLNLWRGFASQNDAEEAIRVAPAIGWCLKMWTMFDCIRESDPEKNSSLADFARVCLTRVGSIIRREATQAR